MPSKVEIRFKVPRDIALQLQKAAKATRLPVATWLRMKLATLLESQSAERESKE